MRNKQTKKSWRKNYKINKNTREIDFKKKINHYQKRKLISAKLGALN